MWEVNKSDAISLLRPMAGFILKDDELIWHSKDLVQPTEAEIEAKMVEMQDEYDAQEYARKRAEAYPSLTDQMDMIMKDNRDGTKTHQTACEAVKKKYPKG